MISRALRISFFILFFFTIIDLPQVLAGNLLQNNSLVYEGAFRVPRNNLGGDSTYPQTLARGGRGLTYNSANNSLIMISRYSEELAVEISIPTPKIEDSIADLNTATLVQAPGDVANGQWDNLKQDNTAIVNGAKAGGLLVYNGKLIGSSYAYYDGAHEAYRSHFTASLTWATSGSNFAGMYAVGSPPAGVSVNGGFVGGYMATVPAEWQTRLGYPALTGKGCIPIIGRTSLGPSIWGFDPGDVGVTDPADAEAFVVYPLDHPTLGTYYGTSLLYNMSTEVNGLVFPDGSDSMLVFGRHGLGFTGQGDGCYGYGVYDPDLHGTTGDGGVTNCYDPVDSTKGTHAYPYINQVWAYDANDILAVKAGTSDPWDVVPYAHWQINLPYSKGNCRILGVAYDSSTQRIFIAQDQTDNLTNIYEPYPIIHVYKVFQPPQLFKLSVD